MRCLRAPAEAELVRRRLERGWKSSSSSSLPPPLVGRIAGWTNSCLATLSRRQSSELLCSAASLEAAPLGPGLGPGNGSKAGEKDG